MTRLAIVALLMLVGLELRAEEATTGFREGFLQEAFPLTREAFKSAPSLALESYRVAPGVGLRIQVPPMGPAPISLDFAWPAVEEQKPAPIYDDTAPRFGPVKTYG